MLRRLFLSLFTGDNYSTDTDGIATYQIKEITELQTLLDKFVE